MSIGIERIFCPTKLSSDKSLAVLDIDMTQELSLFYSFPNVRFFEKMDAGVYRIAGGEQRGTTYKLMEVKKDRKRELLQFTVYMDFVGSVSDYRLGFISFGTWGSTAVSLGNSTTGLKTVNFDRRVVTAAVSPDGNSFMLVFEGKENNFGIRTREGKVKGHDTRISPDHLPQFGFLDDNTYYSFSQKYESVSIGRLDDFGRGNANGVDVGSAFFFPLENSYFVAKTAETLLGLFRVPQEGKIPDEVGKMEVAKLPMYSNIENPQGMPHERLLDLMEEAMEGNEEYEEPTEYEEYEEYEEYLEYEAYEEYEEEEAGKPVSKVRKRLEREAPATLYQMYYEYWLPEHGMRAVSFQMAGTGTLASSEAFIAGEYEAPSGKSWKHKILVWKVGSLRSDKAATPFREVHYRGDWTLLPDGRITGIDIKVDGQVLRAYACCDAQRVHSYMVSTVPIPKELVDIVTGFL